MRTALYRRCANFLAQFQVQSCEFARVKVAAAPSLQDLPTQLRFRSQLSGLTL